jgi:DNA-3-methyladenine glycosylase
MGFPPHGLTSLLGSMTALPQPLAPAFYQRPVLQVARALLGCLLVRRCGGELLIGRIAEVEAYGGELDPASHSYRGCTERCRAMFGPRGHAYVYFTYGNHHCVNIVAGRGPLASAVLLRAVQPIAGLAALRARRALASSSRHRAEQIATGLADAELCSGPGKLTAAFGIDRAFDGQPLAEAAGLWLSPGRPVRGPLWTPRIGLARSEAASWLWRCVDPAATGISRIPSSWPRACRPTPTLGQLRASPRDRASSPRPPLARAHSSQGG